jgi:hypothetical protein
MQMARYWLAGAAALALMTNFASAQTSSSSETTIVTKPAMPAPAPVESYSESRSQKTLDSNGVETTKTEHLDKSQSITGGDGSLNAETHIRTSGQTTTVVPPMPTSTYRSTTTTTTTDK